MFKRPILRLVIFVAILPPVAVAAQANWIGTWAAAPLRSEQAHVEKVRIGETGKTIREVVHVSQGGNSIRLSMTNEFGILPLELQDIHVALRTSKGDIDLKSSHPVTFSLAAVVKLAPGGTATSDPVSMSLPSSTDLAISIFVPQQKIDGLTFHGTALSTTYFAEGDHVGDASLPAADTSHSWYFLKNVQVSAGPAGAAIVAIGDSITDGSFSQMDSNHRWPDELANRLLRNPVTQEFSVLNAGIGGNRLLHDYIGPRAADRFERDVFSAPGVRYVILLEGINDIGFTDKPRGEGDVVTTNEIIAAMRSLIDRAHNCGLTIVGATLTPFMGARYATADGEAMRQTVNDFIRNSHRFDGVIDSDAALRDPANPERLRSAYDSGDHLHPSDAGYAALGDSVNLELFHIKGFHRTEKPIATYPPGPR